MFKHLIAMLLFVSCAPPKTKTKNSFQARSLHADSSLELEVKSDMNDSLLDELETVREHLRLYQETSAYQNPKNQQEWDERDMVDILTKLDKRTLEAAVQAGVWDDIVGNVPAAIKDVEAIAAVTSDGDESLGLADTGQVVTPSTTPNSQTIATETSELPKEKDRELASEEKKENDKTKIAKAGAMMFVAVATTVFVTDMILNTIIRTGTPKNLKEKKPSIKESWNSLPTSIKIQMVANIGVSLGAMGIAVYVMTLDDDKEIGTGVAIALASLLGLRALVPVVTAVRTIVGADAIVDKAIRRATIQAIERDTELGLKGEEARKYADELIAEAKKNPLSEQKINAMYASELDLRISNPDSKLTLEDKLRAVYNDKRFKKNVQIAKKSVGFGTKYGNPVSWLVAGTAGIGGGMAAYGGLALSGGTTLNEKLDRLVKAVKRSRQLP